MIVKFGLKNELVVIEVNVFWQIFDLDCVVVHLNGVLFEGIDEFPLPGWNDADEQ